MANLEDSWDTASNRDALGATRKPVIGQGEKAVEFGDDQWIEIVRRAKSASDQYLSTLRVSWADAYRAYNNQHTAGSRYNDNRWRGRSKHHRPKTRTQVHKADANFANALFTTSDVLTVSPGNPADPEQAAGAAINKALVEYRLDRSSGKAGIPYFMIAVGAHQNARITGLAISKQFWERREAETGNMVPAPVLNEQTGQPIIDQGTGQPLTVMQPERKIIRDRPMIQLFPPDLVLRDPGADWLDQAQNGAWIGLMHPMTIGDIEAMMVDPQQKTAERRWRKIDRSELVKGVIPTEAAATMLAREGQNSNRNDIMQAGMEFDRCWVIEWFMRIQGREWHFWTVGSSVLLSDPVPVEVSYPEQGGERPIVIGVGTIEPHKIDPISHVRALLPMQQEINDLANLTIDGVKESIRPLTYVKRGRNIDIAQIQNRSGDSIVYVDNINEDLGFDRPGAIGGEAFAQMDRLNVDFDDAAGQVNNSTIASSRPLGETVGGLKTATAAANTVADFDTRVVAETWCEPVIRQLIKLEQYYEDDDVILAIAGAKAKLYSKFRISKVDPKLIETECMVSVAIGIGAATPDVKLQKIQQAAGISAAVFGPEIAKRYKQDEIFNEIWGQAGFRDATERFLYPGDQADPRITERDQYIAQLTAQLEEKYAGYEAQLEGKRITEAGKLLNTVIQGEQQQQAAAEQHERNVEAGVIDGEIKGESERRSQAHDIAKTKLAGDQRQKQTETTVSARAAAANGKKANGAKPAPAPRDTDMTPKLEQLLAGIAPRALPQGGPRPPQQAQAAEIMGGQPPSPDGGGGNPEMMKLFAVLVQGQQQLNQTMQMLAQAIMAPNQVVYGADGRPQGTRKVMPGMGGGGVEPPPQQPQPGSMNGARGAAPTPPTMQ